MPATISFSLADLSMVVGVQGVDVFVDGEKQAKLQFGENAIFSVAPGEHTIRTVLYGVVPRHSKTLTVQVNEGKTVAVRGKYSRLWGNIKLKIVK